MFSLQKQSKGFTIVELLIVIVVIGILATLVIVTFTGIQERARDSQRQTDIGAINSHLAAYYADTGTYPAYSMLNDSAWVAANMEGLDADALVGPQGGALNNGAATGDQYGYRAGVGGLATACTVTGTGAAATADCDTFELSALLEKDNGATPYTKGSN